jgi:hypothetical protein
MRRSGCASVQGLAPIADQKKPIKPRSYVLRSKTQYCEPLRTITKLARQYETRHSRPAYRRPVAGSIASTKKSMRHFSQRSNAGSGPSQGISSYATSASPRESWHARRRLLRGRERFAALRAKNLSHGSWFALLACASGLCKRFAPGPRRGTCRSKRRLARRPCASGLIEVRSLTWTHENGCTEADSLKRTH